MLYEKYWKTCKISTRVLMSSNPSWPLSRFHTGPLNRRPWLDLVRRMFSGTFDPKQSVSCGQTSDLGQKINVFPPCVSPAGSLSLPAEALRLDSGAAVAGPPVQMAAGVPPRRPAHRLLQPAGSDRIRWGPHRLGARSLPRQHPHPCTHVMVTTRPPVRRRRSER